MSVGSDRQMNLARSSLPGVERRGESGELIRWQCAPSPRTGGGVGRRFAPAYTALTVSPPCRPVGMGLGPLAG